MLRFALVSPKKNQQKWNEEKIKKNRRTNQKYYNRKKIKGELKGIGNVRLILRNSNTTKHYI